MATTEPITSPGVADSLEKLEKLSLDTQAKTTKVPGPVKTDFYGDNGSYMYQQPYGYMPYEVYSMPGSPMGHDGQMHAMQEYYYPSPYYQAPLQTSQVDASKVKVSTFGASDQASLSAETNGRYPSYTNNLSSGRNQNLQAYSHLMNMHSPGVGQAYGYMNHMYPNNITYGYGNNTRGGYGFGSYGYDARKKGLGWYNVGNNKFRFRGYGKENIDGFNELNKGPRVKGYKTKDGSETATLAVKDQNHSVTKSNGENIVSLAPDMEQYNKEDFPKSYSDAKFFVIKSYSEDDVHKSIKYNVWASTSNGNKKLDAAFHEAKEKHDSCPVFLLFSVNTSGQFVGLAEMVGPVDFNKTLEYWQQDKWTGCFPLKWHIVKDVPNTALRHIILKNNENKPVTNSRDTQEVNLEQGLHILKIFKDHSSKTCILDDFEFYENRQKIIQEQKAKHRLLQKQVSNGEPKDDAVTDSKENEAEVVKANGDVKVIEENSSVAVTEDGPMKLVGVASAC